MPTFRYQAVNDKGVRMKGVQEAQNEHELSQSLREQKLVLVEASLNKGRPTFSIHTLLMGFGGVSLTQKLLLMRNLQVMVAAGVALPRSLEVLAAQSKGKTLLRSLEVMRGEVMKGTSLSDAMEKFPGIFPEFITNMIRSGEESGTMEEVLKHLTMQLERQHELQSKILGALMYPAVVVTAMLGIGVLMLVLVVPQLAQTFLELGIKLPLTTRFVISIGVFIQTRWYVALFLAAAFGVLGAFLFRSRLGKRIAGSVVLRLPLTAPFVRKINAAVTARTLSSLIAAGVPIMEALRITSRVVGNIAYQEALGSISLRVQKGAKLSRAIADYSALFPPLVVQMVEVGEETGQTSEILAKLATFFEDEVADATKNMASVVEPILMLVIGSVVGFFAVSMIQPMYSMLNTL